MEKNSCEKQPLGRSSSSSLSGITKDTAWKSSEPSRNAAVEQNLSASEHFTQHSTASNASISSPQDTVMKPMMSEEEPEGATTNLQTTDCLVLKPSSNTKAICSLGNQPKLDFSHSCWAIRNLAPIVAYCLPSEKAEDWLGDLIEACNDLMQLGMPQWQLNTIALIRISHLIWAAYHITWEDFVNANWGKYK